ncbi:hypothetical protein EMGBS8_05820 [Verrucomicrobiota bacterium]|nr:hypothetical protein EMGBS8_05820 [Verrucomicrobiota bacterium]
MGVGRDCVASVRQQTKASNPTGNPHLPSVNGRDAVAPLPIPLTGLSPKLHPPAHQSPLPVCTFAQANGRFTLLHFLPCPIPNPQSPQNTLPFYPFRG